MASHSFLATSVVVFVVFCGTTDGAVTHSERSCNELDVLTCLEQNAESIINGGGAIDFPAVIEKVCGGNVKTCTQIQPFNKCPEEYRTRILALENSLQKAADALCQNDGALFIEVIAALSCVRLEDLVRCVEAINITSQLDLLTHKRRQQDWDHVNTELSKCIEGTREDREDCKAADFGPVKNVIDNFLTQSPAPNNGSGVTSTTSPPPNNGSGVTSTASPPPNNGSGVTSTASPPPNNGSGVTSTASILTAFVSLLVSLAL
ncbi:uncharacterized protein LOC144169013 [Haemaphysalis longicornis]